MNHNRKIGRLIVAPPIQQKQHDRKQIKVCCTDGPSKEAAKSEEFLEEDRRLVNWKRWCLDRERRQKHIAAALKREPLDLALNAHERVRSKNETKCLLEAARTEVTNQDLYRGNPSFWKVPKPLLKCDVNNDEEPETAPQMDRHSQNLPPLLTRVALSTYIKKEKMLVEAHSDQSKINFNSKWECGDYVRARTVGLQKEIQFLEPKKPEMEDLIVIGKKCDCEDTKCLIRPPVITITNETKNRLLDDPDERIAVKIQDREFVLEKRHYFEKMSREKTKILQEFAEDLNEKKYAYAIFERECVYKILPKNPKAITWNLTFQTQSNELSERNFVLENKGVRTVTVDWRKVPNISVFAPIPERCCSFFFFNKNRISILPGQKIIIPIWFRAERPVIATETWKLLIKPKVYPGTLYLRLWATCSGDNCKVRELRDRKEIICRLDNRVCNSIVRDTIEELILASTQEEIFENIPYDMFFLEVDVFEAKNPTYFYSSALVNELKQIYNDTKIRDENWSLSLEELRSMLLRIEDPNSRLEKLKRFRKICDESLRPTVLYNRPLCLKRKQVYWLLCAFFNRFEDESEFIRVRICTQAISEDMDEESHGAQEMESEICLASRNLPLFHETLFIRIYCLLCNTISGIAAAIDCPNYFNEDDIN